MCDGGHEAPAAEAVELAEVCAEGALLANNLV